MNKLYTKFLAIVLFAFAIGGCKVDAPVYPEGTVSTIGKDKGDNGTGTDPGTGTGTGTDPGTGTGTGAGNGGENTGDGLPIGATNTIQLQLTANGPIKTIKNNVSAISLFGLMSINAIESQSSIIQLGYIGDGAGTFDLSILGTESLTLDQTKPAKVKITQYSFNTTTNKGTIKGTFSADLTDGNGTTYQHAIGSFNISQ